MSTWPASLPQAPLRIGYRESRKDPTIRSPVDIGNDKVRRRYTAVNTTYGVQYMMTSTQLAALETFYVDTLLDGSTEFDWPHPRTGSTVTARFVGPYSISNMGCAYYAVSATIEELP